MNFCAAIWVHEVVNWYMNMSNSDQPLLIWLDDELGTDYDFALTPWRRVIEARASHLGLRIRPCNCLDVFAETLQEAAARSSVPNPVALVVLDVMLNLEGSDSFASLGFPKERFIPLEAGARMAGLIRNPQFHRDRPSWLGAVSSTPMLILSASPQAPTWVARELGSRQSAGVKVVPKNLVRRSDGLAMEPETAFFQALDELL